MSRLLFATALVLGILSVVWMGLFFAGTHTLAFATTAIIGGVYCMGIIELFQFRHATSTLSKALSQVQDPVPGFGQWLDKLDLSIRNTVRLRIEGERIGLPAPVLTPYLAGLLVMLGLLGTFVGMVDTLKGAVSALEGTTELQAIRAGLAAPMRGLGLAFGTSVAGVATSAMLGLMSALSRRDRILETRRLDEKMGTDFRKFSLMHDQRETFRALQDQARAFPELVRNLSALNDKLEHLGENLVENQRAFHESSQAAYSQLAVSVDRSLKQSLAESGRTAGDGIKQGLQDAMAIITQETQHMHRQVALTAKENIESVSGIFVDTAQEVTRAWKDGLQAHNHSNEAFIQRVSGSLDAFREKLESAIVSHLAILGKEFEAPVTRLIHTASEVPHAAAEIIGQLRQDHTKRIGLENRLLEERKHIMEVLEKLSDSLTLAATEQPKTIAQLVDSSKRMLEQAVCQFSGHAVSELSKISEIAESFAASAVEMASSGDALGAAVNLLAKSNENLIENLLQIEQAYEKASSRSQEQLGFCVAQAREIIDQSMLSQKEIFEELRLLRRADDIRVEED